MPDRSVLGIIKLGLKLGEHYDVFNTTLYLKRKYILNLFMEQGKRHFN